MKVCRVVAATMMLALNAHAHPRDAKTTYELLKQGGGLSAKDAEELEERLRKAPKDEEARIQLLSYYAAPPAGADLAMVKTSRSKHILWIIENDPKNGLGLFQIATGVYRLHCQGDDLADPEAFRRAGDMWLEQVRKNPGDSEIRASAIDAIQFCRPEQAEPILIEAKDGAGLGRLYATAALGITGKSYSNGDPAGSDPAFRERPFAQKALRILEGVADKDELVAATITLLRDGATLCADGKLDWDYTFLGNNLLTRAKAAAPDTIALLTLPTTLPRRGERPPVTLRIGGNVQEAQNIRKVAPIYPASARHFGIQGTVQMTALIGIDGKVLYLRADSGPAELIPASAEAVRQWEYRPTLLNGKPCYVETRIDVHFTLSRR